MRFLLQENERRPDPAPVQTDDRVAFATGLGVWLVATGVGAAFIPLLTESGRAWWMTTCVIGCVLGIVGLITARRSRSRR